MDEAEDTEYDVAVASDDFFGMIKCRGSDTIAKFKTSLIQHPDCNYNGSVAGIQLKEGDKVLADNRLVREYNINGDSFITFSIDTTNTTSDESSSNNNNVSSDDVGREIRIYVGFLSGGKQGFDLDIDQNSKIEGLKALIMSKDPDCNPVNQRIFLNGTNLLDDKTLKHYNIEDGSNLFVMLKEPDLIPPSSGLTLLYVSYNNKIHTICVENFTNATIRHVKKLVWEKTKILPAFQRLNFYGDNLESPDQRLCDYGRDGGIKAESFMYLYERRDRDPEPGYSVLPPDTNPDLKVTTPTVNRSAATRNNSNQSAAPNPAEDDRDMITIYLMNESLGDTGEPFKTKKDAPLRQIFHRYAVQKSIPASSLQFQYGEYGDLTPECELSAEALGIESGSMIFVGSEDMSMFQHMSSLSSQMEEEVSTLPSQQSRPSSANWSTPMQQPQSAPSNEIDLTQFSVDGGEAITVTLNFRNSTTPDVQAKIIKDETSLQLLFEYYAEKKGKQSEGLLYFFDGKWLHHDTDKTAAECGMYDGAVIDATSRKKEERKARATIVEFVDSHRLRRKAQEIVINQRKAREVIDAFVWRSIARRRHQKLRDCGKMIQKMIRGHLARKRYGEEVKARLLEFRRFTSVWKQTADLAAKRAAESPQSLSGWALVREGINVKKMEDIEEAENLAETDEKLNKALAGALEEEDDDENDMEEEENESESDEDAMENYSNEAQDSLAKIDWSQFQVTSHVCKFLKNGDTRHREIFVKKMKQLGKGERSHKLQKPLVGCVSVIYETYLENKSGWRILWTQEGDRLVIWFVCQHKSVSRFAKLIDDSKNRASRQQLPDSFISEMQDGVAEKIDVKLDPIGNTPLKLYDVAFDNVQSIVDDSWSPQMHLTPEERNVVEAKGTVLLLGRSGTGKTICICNRMEYDRERLGHKPGFSQLFVSRSRQLCRYVKDAVGDNDGSEFTTFDKLIGHIETSLSQFIDRSFHRGRHVDYSRFKDEFYTVVYPQEKTDALIVWKAIRTFLKGSIEAFQQTDGVLTREYFVGEQLGKNRCKVPLHLRDSLYDIFLQYQQWMSEQHLWDDCDRIFALLKGCENAKKSHSQVFEEDVRKTRLYVDEVQDYLQIEILLFFHIGGGPGALFLAGDPAQSVVEGTDFRFEEIRSVGHYVAGDRRHLIPEKPKVVNINFRSHAGVLKCAGGFLDLLFAHFPGSAKQLKKDHGLFKGARPGVLQSVQVQMLSTLLKEKMPGAVVLVHDDKAASWRERLDHRLVYGIREAKGMEFKSVIILDFFAELPRDLQKPWRDLLLNRYREEDDFSQQFPLVETHLKLVYTAVTRCIEQLFFAETVSSVSGDAAVRWLTTTSTMSARSNKDVLATINNVTDLEAMSMTNDEFCVSGIDEAELVENADYLSLEDAVNYLDRAIYCFQKAQTPELVAKAQVHLQSVKLRDRLKHGKDPTKSQKSMEKEVSRTINLLVKENLFSESLNVLNAVTPLVSPYTQQKLEEYIASPIHVLNNY